MPYMTEGNEFKTNKNKEKHINHLWSLTLTGRLCVCVVQTLHHQQIQPFQRLSVDGAVSRGTQLLREVSNS